MHVSLNGIVRTHGLHLCALVGLVTALSGCSGSVLDAQGPVGASDSAILIDALLIMLVIVVPTIVAAFWIAWYYRTSNTKAKYLPE